ncbi:MAG TPA: phosphatidylserine decarboxylase [Bryobacteraceae bacterium]|nr:phosphatidylserine decarboxylase [Bryobacteraceae bacterium]
MRIVSDGINYACGLTLAGLALSYFLNPWLGTPLYLIALFCLWFFRDPERKIPAGDVIVSPADGKIVAIRNNASETRVSIFLNIFNVHVNRSPTAGRITDIRYTRGKFRVASMEEASAENEKNTITLDAGGARVVFSQIAGLIARRIVCYKQVGDTVATGERIGLIKFGSRVDVFFGPEWAPDVKTGQRVSAGSSVLARRIENGAAS